MIFGKKIQNEYLFNNLLDEANVFLLYLNKDGYIDLCNKHFSDFLGKEKNVIIGKKWDAAMFGEKPQAKQQVFAAVIDASVKHKKPNFFEDAMFDVKNKKHFLSWNINPVFSGEHKHEGTLLIGNDITELKENEISLKNIDETLKNIFSSIKDFALFVTNLSGNITYYGAGAEKVFGWSKNEAIFKHIGLLFKEDALKEIPGMLDLAKLSGKFEQEMELVKKEGERFPVTLNIYPLIDASGNLIGYVFIAKDDTERKKLEFRIFQTEKLAAIGQLAAGIAHEINNPLFVISGTLELLFLSEEKIPKDILTELKKIEEQTDRVRKLMDRVLKFSRQSQLKLETLNINEVIEGVLPLLSYHKLALSKIKINKTYSSQELPIKGDINQLQEVFINLCVNAFQAMPDGGELNITTHAVNLNAEIRISDTGSGISKENLKNLFMPFFTTKKEGTGLGLSICHNIIKSHNGSIDIESVQTKGTTFIIRFPIVS
ncbi:MAG: PAS domain S-box protein [Candidatus Omnitrophica bacterium]|nr:PAS domain S-box protein [Candidatus Omnitrophota bacterium]